MSPNILTRLKESLFWKISLLFFLILVLLGVSYTMITISMAKRYSDETTQKLNANVASAMLLEVNPFTEGKVNDEALGKIMHSMMAVNPGLEVYLLDPQGKILSYVVLDKKVKLQYVSLGPVQEFLRTKGKSLVYGDDPRNPGESTIFSASEVHDKGRLLGYVYMILASEKHETIAAALRESYLLKIGTQSFLLTMIAALIIGLLILRLLMKSLRDIIGTVKQFSEGNLKPRIPIRSTGELAELSVTVNTMADTILRNIEELKEVDKLRRDLIANISHDIRTPISIIHGYIETLIMKQDSLDPQKQQEYLQTILKSTDRLKRLMADLFELSKLESRQIKPRMEPFFMFDLLQDMTRKYKLLAQERNIELETDLSSKMPVVCADIALIERVLQNLIDNALNYTPENGKVKVTMAEHNRLINISVRNTGPGIASEELPRIFDRYYKIENAKSGTGLGLAIVKNILEIHQTDIQVQSENQGTTFSFNLPLLAT
ncbi:MAG TPA: HAMP domain-containing sensor histidine kinase [Cyclobacteriaceae bacterium]|nr:HAMP domain-containing sensor histidine kinase [Cyclobacteriaceae bacterium]